MWFYLLCTTSLHEVEVVEFCPNENNQINATLAVMQLLLFDRTLEERAQRLFLTKGKKLEDVDPAFFAKSKPGKTVGKTR